ncbi:cytochrome c oxidase subunit I [Leptospira semungkisensis]|uniref:Cytochrome c oxidase subunit I n=1 Tax=Leptospira semungkisensis TaxID=2484985 RepID=A0A4R9G6U8_9LEPT|nr:cbb3-type cytochrome c oxidase subunit I [Leptospira semungkisensis]TGK07338.1 cytochrome c oxidase subunit I [Leptospira semungkisensis]
MSERNGNYLQYFKRTLSWLKTSDHKHIGFLYFITIISFFVLVGVYDLSSRLKLSSTDAQNYAGFYNRILFYYGIVILIATTIPGIFGNFILPTAIGAKNLIFPKLNLLSWCLFAIGLTAIVFALVSRNADYYSTLYTRYSEAGTDMRMIYLASGIFILCFSSFLNSLNFIITFHISKAPNVGLSKIPWRAWALYLSVIFQGIAIFSLVSIASLFLSDKNSLVGMFASGLVGDPKPIEYAFTLNFSPFVLYSMLLPAVCLISELILAYSRKLIFGFIATAYSFSVIVGTLVFVWIRYKFGSGKSDFTNILFSLIFIFVGIVIAIWLFQRIVLRFRKNMRFDSPVLFANGFIFLCVIGGLVEIYNYFISIQTEVHLHDTYIVANHSFYIVIGGTVMALMGSFVYYFQEVTHKIYSDLLGKISWLFIFSGFNINFFSQFISNLETPGTNHNYQPRFMELDQVSAFGFWLIGIGLLVSLIGAMQALLAGKQAETNL